MLTSNDLIERRLTAALNALPDTSAGIARFLAERGIRSDSRSSGPMKWCRSCPIALYLEQEIGVPVLVTSCTVVLFDAGIDAPLPVAVSEFIGRVDRGEYPQLVTT